ncbi:MAG: 30S ribosomal protein S3 [candidate division SR1 bacterium]|nr:MAG: 30S ribosomal protein S3 [candidate division SR1 bacterium]
MGQKAHPIGMRVGIMKSWLSEWFAKTQIQGAQFFVEDIKIQDFIEKKFPRTGIAKIVIRKTAKEGEVIIFSAKVGQLMGKNGEKVKQLEADLKKQFGRPFKVVVKEVRVPELSAKIMGEFVASQLENRMPYRKVVKNVLQKVMQKGAKGIKIQIGGRLNGAEIARSEKFIDGRVSLQTFRSDIDYHYLQANTKYGVLGVKVWIEKGVLGNKKKKTKKVIDLK